MSLLFGNCEYKGSDGSHDTEQGNPHGGVAVKGISTYLRLGGLDIDHVVLLQVEIGRLGYVGFIQVEVIYPAYACGVLTEQLYVVAYREEGHIACLCQGFEDGDFFGISGIGARCIDFTQYAEFVVGSTHRDVRYFLQVGLELFTNQGFTFTVGQAHYLEVTQYGEIDTALIVYQVGQQFSPIHTHIVVTGTFFALSDFSVKRSRSFRVGGAYQNSKLILGHDAEVIELSLKGFIEHLFVLKVERFLVRRTPAHQQGGQRQHTDYFAYLHLFLWFCYDFSKGISLRIGRASPLPLPVDRLGAVNTAADNQPQN